MSGAQWHSGAGAQWHSGTVAQGRRGAGAQGRRGAGAQGRRGWYLGWVGAGLAGRGGRRKRRCTD